MHKNRDSHLLKKLFEAVRETNDATQKKFARIIKKVNEVQDAQSVVLEGKNNVEVHFYIQDAKDREDDARRIHRNIVNRSYRESIAFDKQQSRDEYARRFSG